MGKNKYVQGTSSEALASEFFEYLEDMFDVRLFCYV